MFPPPVSTVAPCMQETTETLPPPLSALSFPLAEATLMFPPPVRTFTSLPAVPTSMVPPPVSASIAPPLSSRRILPASATLPVSDDPDGVALRVSADLVRLKFTAGLLLGGGISTIMNNVTDSRLRAALDPYRSHVYFDVD